VNGIKPMVSPHVRIGFSNRWKMPNKNYISGRTFEYKVRDYLESKGYVVVRSAGSHTPIDLIAFNCFGLILVQCKHGKIRLPEISDFIKLSQKYFEHSFYVATAERNGNKVDVVFYGVTPAGNLIRMERF